MVTYKASGPWAGGREERGGKEEGKEKDMKGSNKGKREGKSVM